MRKNFKVQIYYTGFCSYNIEAENTDVAILKARELIINSEELLSNLENWKEADTAIKIEDEKVKE